MTAPSRAAHPIRAGIQQPDGESTWRSPPGAGSLERRLGAALIRLHTGRHYRSLGFVRLADYVAERLGVSHRTAQEWMRVEDALATLPAMAAAFESGEITSGHVRILARVATRETETFWIALARRSAVRQLAGAVAIAAGEESDSTTASAPGEAGSPRLEIDAPAWVAAVWRDTVSIARKLLNFEATAGECLEMVLAEFGSGAGVEWTGDAASIEGALDAVRDLHASASRERSIESALPNDARALDCELRRLVCERQRREAALAAHLRQVGRERGYRREGFASLEAHARERCGLSPRRLYYLLALGRTLDELPGVRTAFLAGRLTMKQALLIGAVAARRTEAAWIARAEGGGLLPGCMRLRRARPSGWFAHSRRTVKRSRSRNPGQGSACGWNRGS